MKNLTKIIFFFFSINFVFAQDISECEKIAFEIYDAVNNKNAESVYKYFSDDFNIKGQPSEYSSMIFAEFCDASFNLSFKNIKKVNEIKKNDELILEFESLVNDSKTVKSSFIFNKNNQLKTLFLLPISTNISEE